MIEYTIICNNNIDNGNQGSTYRGTALQMAKSTTASGASEAGPATLDPPTNDGDLDAWNSPSDDDETNEEEPVDDSAGDPLLPDEPPPNDLSGDSDTDTEEPEETATANTNLQMKF